MGPLAGFEDLEFGGIGPRPVCAMLLADLGAAVLRTERRESVELGPKRARRYDLLLRDRHAVRFELEAEQGFAVTMQLIEEADAVIEGFRPGDMERLGLGPEVCLQRSRLVYGRMAGWGQSGPLAQAAGAGFTLNFLCASALIQRRSASK